MMRLSKPPDLVFNFKYTSFPDLRIITVLLIFTVFSVPFTETSFSNQSLFLSWIVVGGAITATIIGLLFLMKFLCEKRYGQSIPLSLIVLGGGALGGLKGASTEFFINLVAIGQAVPWDEMAVRAYSGSFLGVGLGFAFSLKATYSDEISKNYNKFHDENQRLTEEIATMGRELDLLRDESQDRILKKIIQNITPIATLDFLATDPEKNWRQISEALRVGLSKRVRQESYDLNYVGDKPLSIKEQIQKIFLLEKVNLHPRVLALVQFSTGASITYIDWNPQGSALQLLMNTFVSIIVTTYFRTLLRGRANPSKAFNLLIIWGVIFVNGSLYALVGFILWSKFDPFFQISLFFWHTFLVLTISSVSEIIQYMNVQKDLQENVYQDLIDKRRVMKDHLESQRNEISKHLHGFLITKIHSSATLLDNYAENGDFMSYRSELTKLLKEFTIEGLRSSLNRDVVSSDYFSNLLESWDGMIGISLQVPETLNLTVKKAQRIELAHVIEELISNAYRHGEAQQITITVRWLGDDTLEIEATDNGKGAVLPVKPGLGSKIFQMASDGNWSLRNNPSEGVHVKLIVQLYDPESQVGLTSAEHEDVDQPVGQTP